MISKETKIELAEERISILYSLIGACIEEKTDNYLSYCLTEIAALRQEIQDLRKSS